MIAERLTPYERLLKTGAKMDNHESDLYVEVTPATTALIGKIARGRVGCQRISGQPVWEQVV